MKESEWLPENIALQRTKPAQAQEASPLNAVFAGPKQGERAVQC